LFADVCHFNVPSSYTGQPLPEHCDLLHFSNSYESRKKRSPEQLVTIKLRDKIRSAWLDVKLNATKASSDPNAVLSFLLLPLSLSLWGRVLWLPVIKVTFVCYSSSLRSSRTSLAWELYKRAQVINSNLISEWLWKKFQWKKTHWKVPNEPYVIETLIKLQYCSE